MAIGPVGLHSATIVTKTNTKVTKGEFAKELEGKTEKGTAPQPRGDSITVRGGLKSPDGRFLDDKYNIYPPYGSASKKALEKLAELRQTAKDQDYTGMTSKEIYKSIYDRYEKAFDGNYSGMLDAGVRFPLNINGTSGWKYVSSDETTMVDMYSQYREELSKGIGKEWDELVKYRGPDNGLRANNEREFSRDALYNKMTDEEIEEKLMTEYKNSEGRPLDYISFIKKLEGVGLMPYETYSAITNNMKHNAMKRGYAKTGRDLVTEGLEDPMRYAYASDYMQNERVSFESISNDFYYNNEKMYKEDIANLKPYLENLMDKLRKAEEELWKEK